MNKDRIITKISFCMKIRNMLVTTSVVLMAIAASCTKEKQNYASFIPKDPALVVSVNPRSLLDKSGILDNDQIRSVILDAASDNLNAAGIEIVNSLVSNPAESGIDLGKNAYFWVEDFEKSIGGIVFALADNDKFTMALAMAIDEGRLGDLPRLSHYGECLITGNDDMALAAGEDYFLLLAGGEETKHLEKLKAGITMENDSGYTSTDAYKRIVSSKFDAVAMLSMKDVIGYAKSNETYRANAQKGLGTDNEYLQIFEKYRIEESYLMAGLAFDNGKATFEYSLVSDSPEWNDFAKETFLANGQVSGRLMEYFNDNALAVAFMCMDGSETAKMLKDIPQYANLFDESSLQHDVWQLLSSINGQVAIGMNSFSLLPDVTLLAEVQNDDLVHAMNSLLNGLETSQGRYVANIFDIVSLYYGIEDGIFYATLSPDSRNALKKPNPSFAASKHSAKAKGSYGYYGIDVNSLLTLSFSQSLRGKLTPQAYSLLRSIDYIELCTTDIMKFEIVIYTNSDENTLKILTDFIAANL